MIEIVFSGIVSVVAAVLGFLLKSSIKENHRLKQEKSEEEKKTLTALKDGVKCLLRSKLMEYHDIYVEEKHITSTEYENWTQMYKAYHDLHGNGMITHMAEDIEDLKMDK